MLSGVVVAFAGDEIPASGWALCDGRSVSKDDPKYQALFQAIGTIHGGDANPNFQLPDYRGLFLRGVDHGAGRDPDARRRTSPGAGGSGAIADSVGSIQGDEVERHNHANGQHNTLSAVTGRDTVHAPTDNSPGELNIRHGGTIRSVGGNETRPKNAYVNYIIKL